MNTDDLNFENDRKKATTYYKIGDFAKLAHISISRLRYYDEIGLLKPYSINKDSNYRFYDSTQLDRVATIKSFQRHGMSLQQMKKILHNKNNFFQQMAIFSENKVDELNRQIDTLIHMRNEYENLALTYPVLARELEINQIIYAPISPYKVIRTGYMEKDIFLRSSDNTESYLYMKKLCDELSSVQWFASDTGYIIDLTENIELKGELIFRLSSRHPQIASNTLETFPSADYVRYIAPMNEQDTIDNFYHMLEYCKKISRTPQPFGYIWFMVDDYEDGTGQPIIQLCIPLKPQETNN